MEGSTVSDRAWSPDESTDRPKIEHTERIPDPLRGYRKVSEADRILVDEIKLAEEALAKLWARVYEGAATTNASRYALAAEEHFRDGFMNLVRAVTLPRDAYREAFAAVEQVRQEGP